MKKSKFPTTEKEVIAFEEKYKSNYVEPKEWTSAEDIIQGKQLNLQDVIQSSGVNNEIILGVLSQEQVDKGVSPCDLCKYKKFGNGGNDCTKCVNEGQPHQYFL